MQKTYFKKQKKVFVLLKIVMLMMIVFNTGISGKLYSQESKQEDVRAYMDSIRARHFEKMELMKKEILEKQASKKEAIHSATNEENTVIINGKYNTSKDSILINSQDGVFVKSMGASNSIIIDSNENSNSVIVTQTGNGNNAIVSQSNSKPKTTKKENF